MITKYENYCSLCGSPRQNVHHCVFGFGKRNLADEDGLTMPLCSECHTFIHGNGKASMMSKIIGQLEFEKHEVAKGKTEDEAREIFRKRYHQSYL